jgi:tetratricopeptide (TPR) repeat protein
MYTNPFRDKKFLVVDDFADMRNTLKNILRMIGGEDIDAANNGLEAVEAMEKKKYDIIMCDYNLGAGKDGQQVLEEARHRKLISMSTVFIMVTAENTREMVMGAIEYEPDSYISKPFSKDLIKARIEKVMMKKDELREVFEFVESRKVDSAIEILDKKMASKPKNMGELMKVKAEICLNAEKYDCAQEIYERVLILREIPWAKLGLGKVLFGKKKYAEAAEVFRELAASNPDLTAAMDWLARAYHAMGDLDDAKSILKAAIKISPKAILRQKMLGDLCMESGDFAGAEQAFAETVRQGKNSVHNHPSMYSNLAKSQSNQNKHDVALLSLKKIDDVFGMDQEADFYRASGEAFVFHNKGDVQRAGESMLKAEKYFERAGAQISNNSILELAQVASKMGNQDKAQKLLVDAIQNNHDDDEFLQSITSTLHSMGLHDDPEQFVAGLKREVIEMNNKGVMLLQKGHLDEAVELFREAASRMTANRVINLNAARAMLMLMEDQGTSSESLSEMRRYLDRLKKMNPDDQTLKGLMARLQKVVMAA